MILFFDINSSKLVEKNWSNPELGPADEAVEEVVEETAEEEEEEENNVLTALGSESPAKFFFGCVNSAKRCTMIPSS